MSSVDTIATFDMTLRKMSDGRVEWFSTHTRRPGNGVAGAGGNLILRGFWLTDSTVTTIAAYVDGGTSRIDDGTTVIVEKCRRVAA
jgi:hypothetical protein